MAKKVIVGDIWKQKGFKVVSTNLGGVHGRGLAAQAKQQGKITASNVSFATSPKNSDVITLAVKGNAPETAKVRGRAYSEKTTGKNVELLKSEVKQLIQFARKNPTKNVNLPFIGLGFGEGNPDEILPILREAEKEPNIFLVSKDEGTVKRYQSTFRAGVRTDKSIRNLSKAIKSRVSSTSKNMPMNFSYGNQGLPGTKATTFQEIFEGKRRSTLRKAGTTNYKVGEIVNITDKSGNVGKVKVTGIRKVDSSMSEELSKTERWKPEFIKNYIKSGSWEQISYEPVSKPNIAKISAPAKQTNVPSNAKTIYFQGPSGGISDPEAFKKALTKRYSEAKKKHGDVQVQFRGSSTSQADQLIGEWASEGFRKYRHAKQLHTDFKTMSKVTRSPQLFRTNERGMPIIDKEAINISKINAPGESVEKISFSSKGKIVYPGKSTKKHHERFLELTGSPKQGGLGLKKGFEAYLDELEDIGRGSTKQALDKPRTLSIKGKKVTRLPIIGEGQGQVTKVKADIKSMLAGLQVAEDKAKYYSLDQPTLDRISNLKKDVPYPVKSGEYLNISEADSPDLQFIETEDDPNFGPENLNKQYKGKGPFHFGKFGLKAVLSKSDELKPELKDYTDDDKKIRHLSKVDEESMSQEDKAIKKENKQLGKLTKIVKGSRQWKKWTKAPASRRILLNIIGDVFKNKTDTVLPSEKVIRGPHLKGKLISADKVHWTEKQYIGRDRNPELKIRKDMSDEKKLAKQKRIGEKVSNLRRSGDRSLASIKSYIAQNTAPDKTLSTSGGVVGTRWYPGKGIKLPEKTFPKKPHTPGLKVDAPIDARPKIKIKKVTKSIQKYHKPLSKEAGIKAIEDKLKVKAEKKALPQDPKTTSKVTKELQKQFHGKDKPRYKTTVGKGLKFTRGLGAFSLFSSIFGLVRGRAEAKKELGRDPTIMETFNFTVLPEAVRKKMPKYQRKFTNVQDIQ